MKVVSLNLRLGGQSRTDSILRYLLDIRPSIMVLSEFKDDNNGKKIREVIEDDGFSCEASDGDYGVLVATHYPSYLKERKKRWVEIEFYMWT